MLETLLVTFCIYSSNACTYSLQAYYHTDRPVVQTIKNVERKANRALKRYPETAYLGPFISYATQREITVKITRNISTTIGNNSGAVQWTIGF